MVRLADRHACARVGAAGRVGLRGTTSTPTTALSSEPSSTAGVASVEVFLRDDGRFEIPVELMSARNVPGHNASLLEVLETEASPGTLFAPTDAAFETLGFGAIETNARRAVADDRPREAHRAWHTRVGRSEQWPTQIWGAGSHVTVEVNGLRIEYGGAMVIERDIEVGDW